MTNNNNNNEHNKAEKFYNGQQAADKKEGYDPFAPYWYPGQTSIKKPTQEKLFDILRGKHNLG